ncbi:Fructose dehydrogenase large subunit [Marinomonas spartinae]|uniref:GMC family oxidoreductase n=1 Tax=Marinomonas spartinae TaxID=1792290 RepID=UPI000808F174|nr:GMC family oxidoreductase [Marinomonas spartinae]SBS40442.1 Fructose dehydrogenase large subunit [Marinomonas spartinae]
MMKSHYDFVVVGSGAAGAAAAWRLCQKGYRVVCLERGKNLFPENYPSTKTNWELKKRGEFSPIASSRRLDSDYPVDDSESPIAVCNYNAVGGSTILYSAHFPRFRPRDFKIHSEDGLYEDWPISYEDLKPYFELNESEMSVSGLVGDPMYPDIENLLPPVPMGNTGETIAKAFNQKGWHWWPSYGAISTRSVKGRDACINLGPCNTGCPQGAKSSVDITYLARAKRLGLTVLTECAVDSVIVEGDRAKGVIYFDKTGARHELIAENVVLAASAIGTPRILLNSKDETEKSIANSSGLIGKNLMIHPLGYVEGVFDETLDTDIGPQGCLIYSLEHYRSENKDFNLGYMMHVLRGTGPIETATSALSRRKLRFGQALEEDFFKFYKKQIAISIICDDLPQESNCVELSDVNDRFGTPGVKIKYEVSENTLRMMKDGMANAREILSLAGANKTYAYGPVRNTGWHIMGTCKMGNDPNNSVVNAIGESHDVKRLFVIDSSCFVTGSCVNPANTIQSLALYLTDKIINCYG